MAMSRKSERALKKQRELLWHYLEGETCSLCGKPLITTNLKIRFGNATAPPIDVQTITIHHEDENHENNRKSNRKVVHQSCHKSHHARKVFAAWRRNQKRRAA